MTQWFLLHPHVTNSKLLQTAQTEGFLHLVAITSAAQLCKGFAWRPTHKIIGPWLESGVHVSVLIISQAMCKLVTPVSNEVMGSSYSYLYKLVSEPEPLYDEEGSEEEFTFEFPYGMLTWPIRFVDCKWQSSPCCHCWEVLFAGIYNLESWLWNLLD